MSEPSEKEVVGTVVICSGPPKCEWQDDEAVENQEAGCPVCTIIDIHPDGSETVRKRKAH